MYGNIDWTDPQINNPLRFPFAEICQGSIIAHQKRQTGIVILKIQAITHIGRHLIHKTEQAVVGAATLLIHEIRFKVEADILAFLLADMHCTFSTRPACAAPRSAQDHRHKTIVQHILDRFPLMLSKVSPTWIRARAGEPGSMDAIFPDKAFAPPPAATMRKMPIMASRTLLCRYYKQISAQSQ